MTDLRDQIARLASRVCADELGAADDCLCNTLADAVMAIVAAELERQDAQIEDDRSAALTRVIALIEEYERMPWDVPVVVSAFRRAVGGRRR